MEPREFFIEDRLEGYRNEAFCNLGESGLKCQNLGEVMEMAEISILEIQNLPLNDSPNQGSYELRNEVARLYPGVEPEEILITTGTGEALYLAFHLLIKPGKKFSVLWPSFQALYEIPQMLGGFPHPIQVNGELKSEMWKGLPVDLHIINHPHNPTGQSFSDSEWDDLLLFLDKENTTTIFDEHYRFLPRFGGMGRTGVNPKRGLFGTGSFTKCFGVTGLRVGWLIADREFIKRARSFKDYLTHTVSPISECLAIGLLKNRNNFLPKIQSNLKNNLDYFESVVMDLPKVISYKPIFGGLVGWLGLEEGTLSEDYADKLYEKTGVFVLPGKNFETEGFLRVGFGEEPNRFQEGILRWLECRI
ncbi:pyridoxal phosphate-dependent aminotransferase [Leptospira sp. 96542]|nr:pyridoxal phosphate-dependent aminotransferase [Leptospira sp. 96542]